MRRRGTSNLRFDRVLFEAFIQSYGGPSVEEQGATDFILKLMQRRRGAISFLGFYFLFYIQSCDTVPLTMYCYEISSDNAFIGKSLMPFWCYIEFFFHLLYNCVVDEFLMPNFCLTPFLYNPKKPLLIFCLKKTLLAAHIHIVMSKLDL